MKKTTKIVTTTEEFDENESLVKRTVVSEERVEEGVPTPSYPGIYPYPSTTPNITITNPKTMPAYQLYSNCTS